jgi:hypothetical protein
MLATSLILRVGTSLSKVVSNLAMACKVLNYMRGELAD